MVLQSYTLAELRRMVASRPVGWACFTPDDYFRAHPRKHSSRRRYREQVRERFGRRFFSALDTLSYAGGSVSTWTSAGGSGIGGTITCTSLASGSSRQGVKSATSIVAPPNGGTNAVPPDYFAVLLVMQYAVAPTDAGTVDLYFGFSSSATAGTSNPGGLTGTDAAGPTAAGDLGQLAFPGSLVASNARGTGVQLGNPVVLVNPDPVNSPYLLPVILNNSNGGQAFDSTAAHTTLTVVPYWRQRAA